MAHIPWTRTEFHEEDERNQPDGLDGNGREDELQRAIRPGKRVGEKCAHHGAGRAEGGNAGIAQEPDSHDVRDERDGGDQEAGPDPANEVVPEEALFSPVQRHLTAEHPEREHVEYDVEGRVQGVKPHVGERAPQLESQPDVQGRNDALHRDAGRRVGRQMLSDEYDQIRDQQVLDDVRSDGGAKSHLISTAVHV